MVAADRIECWDRARAVATPDPSALDDLAGRVLVLDGVTADDDGALDWCRRTPAVVVSCSPDGESPPSAPDLVLAGGADDHRELLRRLAERVDANPLAATVLMGVLRTLPDLDVAAGLTVESLAYSTLLAGPEFGRWLAAQPPRPPRAHAGPAIRVDRRDGELRIALARPENRNAFSAALRDALIDALAVVELDPSVTHVVLTGDGPTFCSGGDLTEFGTTPDVATAHAIRTRRSVGAALARLDATTTVEVHGACVGAGVELPAFADRVVAAPDTTFRLPEVAMGLIPGAGGTVSLTRRIGRQATGRLALLGDAVDAAEALALGLVDEVHAT